LGFGTSREVKVNGTTNVEDALRDLFHFHFGRFNFGRQTWLPLLLATAVLGALVVHLRGLMSSLPAGAGYLYSPGPAGVSYIAP
jgi:hypothetical protein